MNSTRTFGVEIEAHLPVGTTRGQLAIALRRAHVACACEDYNHVTPQGRWKLTTDRSLGDMRRSVEVVSPPLSGQAGLDALRRVMDTMRAFGCTISTRCGLHVHVFAGDLTVDQIRNLAINFIHCETAFDAIMPPSRRRDGNQFVLSNRTAFGGNYDNDAINRAIDAYLAATDMRSLIAVVSAAGRGGGDSDFNRYRKFNLRAFNRYRTVEFRQHSGTVEADKACKWVELCVAFVDRTPTSRPRKRPSMKPHTPAKELAVLMKFVRATPEMRRFYQARAKALSEAALQRAREAAEASGQRYTAPAE